SHVKETAPGADPVKSSPDHAVYVHYDRHGVVHDYVIEQLRQLAVANFRITFVSNAPKLNKDGLSAVLPHCRLAIIRRNVGFDFGAYKDGITSIGDIVACDRLLLMNDSVYGPFWPISEFLDKADPANADFWGITDSWDTHYHVQSYFL